MMALAVALGRSICKLSAPANFARFSGVNKSSLVRHFSSFLQEKVYDHNFTEEEYDKRIYAYITKPDIDHWEIRKAMNELTGKDFIPEPYVVEAILRAGRKLNDHSLCVRYLESIKWKSEGMDKDIWPWMLQELKPVIDELGISLPAELGYDKPELAIPADVV